MTQSSQSLYSAYESWSPVSRQLTEQARRYLPGGDTRASAYYRPYPLYIENGSGCPVFVSS